MLLTFSSLRGETTRWLSGNFVFRNSFPQIQGDLGNPDREKIRTTSDTKSTRKQKHMIPKPRDTKTTRGQNLHWGKPRMILQGLEPEERSSGLSIAWCLLTHFTEVLDPYQQSYTRVPDEISRYLYCITDKVLRLSTLPDNLVSPPLASMMTS